MLEKENIRKFLKEMEVEDLVTNLQLVGNEVHIDMISHSAALHEKKKLEADMKIAFTNEFGNDFDLKLKISSPENTTIKTKEKHIEGVQNIILIASAKGGVGKSTVAANLAISLHQLGYSIGLLDADIHGPSIPTLLNSVNQKPITETKNGKNYIKPIESHGIKTISMGHFSANMNQAIVWRGPMASKALVQMLKDADWGELDYLLIDLPPGTSDIHLSVVQEVKADGVVIVTTPQQVALNDVQKGISMFQMDAIDVPILGIIENMAYFTPAELPQNKYYLFGKDGGKKIAKDLDLPFLGEIPIIETIREGGDIGEPSILNQQNIEATIYKNITKNILLHLGKHNSNP